METNAGASTRMWRAGLALLIVLGAAMAIVRWSAPADLLDNDQWLTTSYTVDIFANGSWIAQREPSGRPATKPPLQPWLAAIVSAPFGKVTWLSAGIPVALATIGTALLAAFAARRWFGERAGLIAGGAAIFVPVMVKHVWLIRPDSVYVLAVFAGTLLVWRAWDRGRGWVWVWLAAALVTLAKTPFGVALMLAGLLAALTVKREAGEIEARARRRVVIENVIGVVLFVVIAGGWFLAARWKLGDAFTQTALGDEIAGHAVGAKDDQFLGKGFLRAPVYFLVRLAPWSVIAVIAMVRLWREPAADLRMRRLERFLFFATVGGLFIAGFAAKPRPEHIVPLAPLVAVLAGRELSSWTFGVRRLSALAVVCIAGLASVGAAWFQYHVARRDLPKVVTGAGMRELAREVRPLVEAGAEFVDVDAPYALQFELGTMRVRVSVPEANEWLRGEGARLVFADAATSGALGGAVIARWPREDAAVVVVGNEAARAMVDGAR